jgi:CIC family chloride channel protein
MAALMGGTMRAPFMGTLFALETTHAWSLAPVVFVGCVAATAFTVVFVPRSILTEKLARRGMHVAREYAVHPLELIAVTAVMHPVVHGATQPRHSIEAGDRVRSAANVMAEYGDREVAVVDETGAWIGNVTADDLLVAWRQGMHAETRRRRVRRIRDMGRTATEPS